MLVQVTTEAANQTWCLAASCSRVVTTNTDITVCCSFRDAGSQLLSDELLCHKSSVPISTDASRVSVHCWKPAWKKSSSLLFWHWRQVSWAQLSMWCDFYVSRKVTFECAYKTERYDFQTISKMLFLPNTNLDSAMLHFINDINNNNHIYQTHLWCVYFQFVSDGCWSVRASSQQVRVRTRFHDSQQDNEPVGISLQEPQVSTCKTGKCC